MSSHSVPVIGFVGGIGAGKSALARWAVQHSGVNTIVLDADVIGHQALKQPEIRQRLTVEFGQSIVNDNGEIERSKLAKLVFGDNPEHRQRRQFLESIVHPYIRQQINQEIKATKSGTAVDLIILDAAVMLESGWHGKCDLILFLDVPEEERIRRVQTTRNWTVESFRRREASQWSLDRKRQAAHAVINMDQPVSEAGTELKQILSEHFPKLHDNFSR